MIRTLLIVSFLGLLVAAAEKPVRKSELRKNDVVKEISGKKVKDPAQAMELYNKMKADDRALVERGLDGKDQGKKVNK